MHRQWQAFPGPRWSPVPQPSSPWAKGSAEELPLAVVGKHLVGKMMVASLTLIVRVTCSMNLQTWGHSLTKGLCLAVALPTVEGTACQG